MHNLHTNTLTLPPSALGQSLPPARSALWAARMLRAAHCAVLQVAGASLVQIEVVRAFDGGTRTVRVEVDGAGVLCHLHSLTNGTPALAHLWSVAAVLLPQQTWVAILGFGRCAFVVPSLWLQPS